MSAVRHWHARQDEFVYVLEGELTLVTENGEQALGAGLCAGFPAGKPDGHQLINRTDRVAVYLEVGDRLPGRIIPMRTSKRVRPAADMAFSIRTGRPTRR